MSSANWISVILVSGMIFLPDCYGGELLPSSIQRLAAPGTEISCPHFRARLRNEQSAFGELVWHLDSSTDSQEVERYFKNRLAADPMDVAGQRVVEVKWSAPKSEFPIGGQVVGFYELTRQDYSGAQMKFEVSGRAVEINGETVEIRTPVRMVDVCMNGYIDLKLFSKCPIETLKFWRPIPEDQPVLSTIVVPDCKHVETVRLSLAGVDSKLSRDKTALVRGADSSPHPISSKLSRCDNDAIKTARLLESLLTVRRVHNCEVDVIRRESKDDIEYSIYARDLNACQRLKSACLESEVSLAVAKNCLAQADAGTSPSLRFRSGVLRDSAYIAAGLSAQMNRLGQLIELDIVHSNIKTGDRIDHVNCRPSQLGIGYGF